MDFNNQMIYPAIYAAIVAGKAILEIYGTNDFEVESKEDQTPLTLADRTAHNIISNMLKETGIPLLSEEGLEIPFSQRSQWQSLWMVDPLDGTKEFIKRNNEFTVNIALIENQSPVLGIIYVPVTGNLYVGEVSSGAWFLEDASGVEAVEDIPLLKGSKLPRFTKEYYGIVASRSHLNKETAAFIEEASAYNSRVQIVSRGSSLKLCMIAEGEAHIYPRFAPTMEWDTAAGHAICNSAGARVHLADNPDQELIYNKPDMHNPWFIAKRGA